MEVTAEMVLKIARLRAQADEAKREFREIGRSGERAASRANRAFALRGGAGAAGGQASRDTFNRSLRTQRSLNVAMAASAGGATAATGKLARGLRFLAYVAGTAGVAVGAIFAADSIRSVGQFEQVALQVGAFTGSMEKAKVILEDLSEFSVRTPFESANLENLTASLLSAGIEGRRVVDVVKSLAAISKDDSQLNGLGAALGKGFAKGKFDLEQINQFLERQVNLLPALSQVTGKTGTDLTKAISAGEIGFEEMYSAIKLMSAEGGQFFGLMELNSKTLVGLWSTLLDNVTKFRRELFEPSLEPLKEGVTAAIGLMQELTENARTWGARMADGIDLFIAFKSVAKEVGFVELLTAGIESAINQAWQWASTWTESARITAVTMSDLLVDAVIDAIPTMLTAWAGLVEEMGSKLAVSLANGGLAALDSLGVIFEKIPGFTDLKIHAQGTLLAARGEARANESGGRTLKELALEQLNVKLKELNLKYSQQQIRNHFEIAKLQQTRGQRGIFPTREDYLQKMAENIFERYSNRSGPQLPPQRDTGVEPIDSDELNRDDAAGRQVVSAPGRFAQAVNRIAGRSSTQLIVSELSTATSVLRAIDRGVKDMNEYLRKEAGQETATVGVFD